MQAVIENVSEQLQLCYSPLTDSNIRTIVKHKTKKKTCNKHFGSARENCAVRTVFN